MATKKIGSALSLNENNFNQHSHGIQHAPQMNPIAASAYTQKTTSAVMTDFGPKMQASSQVAQAMASEIRQDPRIRQATQITNELRDAARDINQGRNPHLENYTTAFHAYGTSATTHASMGTTENKAPTSTFGDGASHAQSTSQDVNKVISGISKTEYGRTSYGSDSHYTPYVLHTAGQYLIGAHALRDTDAGQVAWKVKQNFGWIGSTIAVAGLKEVAKQNALKSKSELLMNGTSFTQFQNKTNNALIEIKNITGIDAGKVDFNKAGSIKRFQRKLDKAGQAAGLGKLSNLSSNQMKQMLSDPKINKQRKALLNGALQAKYLNEFQCKAPNQLLKSINPDAKELKTNYNSLSSIKQETKEFRKAFVKAGMPDYTRMSTKELNKRLQQSDALKEKVKNGYKLKGNEKILSKNEHDAITKILSNRKQSKFLQKVKQATHKLNMNRLIALSSKLEGCDAFDGARMIMQAANSAKSALIAARAVALLSGKGLLKIGRHLPGTKQLINLVDKKVTTFRNKRIQKRLDAEKLSKDIKAIKKQVRKIKLDSAKNKLRSKLLTNKLGTKFVKAADFLGKFKNPAKNLSKKISEKAAAALAKIMSPVKALKNVIGRIAGFGATLRRFAFMALAYLAGIFIVLNILLGVIGMISGATGHSQASLIDENGNKVSQPSESYFVQVYNELMGKDNSWYADIENSKDKTPSEVAGHKITGFYNPTDYSNSGSMYEVPTWGTKTTDEDGNEIQNGLVYYFYNGDNEAAARFSNVKMCMSMGHAFVGGHYTNHELFREFCVALWDASRHWEVAVTAPYSCSTGCDTYKYYCNANAAYQLNIANPEANNYVYIIEGNTNGTKIGKHAFVPKTEHGCIKRVYNNYNNSYIDTYKYDNNKQVIGNNGSNVKWHTKYFVDYTVNKADGGTTIVQENPTYSQNVACVGCSPKIVFCNNQNELNSAALRNACNNKETIYCSGCHTTYDGYTRTINGTTYEHYMDSKCSNCKPVKMTTFCANNTGHILYGNSCPCGNYTVITQKHEESTVKERPMMSKGDDGKFYIIPVPFSEVGQECPSRKIESATYTTQRPDGVTVTAPYTKYVCNCENKIECRGKTTTFYTCKGHTSCPGHVVCYGHCQCQGHWRCEGHTANICLGHVDGEISATIIGLDEDNNLRVNTSDIKYGDKTYEQMVNESGFPGWDIPNTEYMIQALFKADWYQEYGISSTGVEGETLTEAEKQEIMGMYNLNTESLSETRLNLVTWALDSVGRIPYYWGGNANAMGFDAANHFGEPGESRTTGGGSYTSNIIGLDCAGWIDWVYWTATGSHNLKDIHHNYRTFGKAVAFSDAKPGDCLWKDGHVGMFIEWVDKSKGKMLVCHETPGNVKTSVMSTSSWNGVRRLLGD